MKTLGKLTFATILLAGLVAQAKAPVLTPSQDEKEPVKERVVASQSVSETQMPAIKVSEPQGVKEMHPMIYRMWMHEFHPHGPKI